MTSGISHLFPSVVRVEKLDLTQVNGRPSMNWVQAHDDDPTLDFMLSYLPCRLDMSFLRPGKDVIPAPEAGKAPDRIGVMFCDTEAPLKAGMRIVTIDDDDGDQVIRGIFEISVIPDQAIDYSDSHHIEVQIRETTQALTAVWPDDPDYS